MAKLLVSVRNAREAQLALSAGADLIDVKDPAKGSLGAPDLDVVARVVDEVRDRVPLSVALGELRDWGRLDSLAIPGGINYAKVGMAGCARWSDWPERWARLRKRFPPHVRPVAVVYADADAAAPEAERIVIEAVRLGCGAVLIDTFDKSQGSLLDAWSLKRLGAFLVAVQQQGMLAVVGGSLTLATIDCVAALGPDYVALRGAVCRDGRNGSLDPELVRRAALETAGAKNLVPR